MLVLVAGVAAGVLDAVAGAGATAAVLGGVGGWVSAAVELTGGEVTTWAVLTAVGSSRSLI